MVSYFISFKLDMKLVMANETTLSLTHPCILISLIKSKQLFKKIAW